MNAFINEYVHSLLNPFNDYDDYHAEYNRRRSIFFICYKMLHMTIKNTLELLLMFKTVTMCSIGIDISFKQC